MVKLLKEIRMGKPILKHRLTINIIQFVLLITAFCLFFKILYLNGEQSRVSEALNQAGYFRCLPQRIVATELMNSENQELERVFQELILSLKSRDENFSFDILEGESYQELISNLAVIWNELKRELYNYSEAEIEEVYSSPSAVEQNILEDSEVYFEVSNALIEEIKLHSGKIAKKIKINLSILIAVLFSVVLISFLELVLVSRRYHELSSLAFRDSLTGLSNRYACDQYLMNLSGHLLYHVGVVIFDLNNLKECNDEWGHDAGDRLIQRFGAILNRFTTSNIFVSRNGGDEFLLVVKKKTDVEMRQLLKEIDEAVRDANKNSLKGEHIISYSVGLAYGNGSIYQLVKEADNEMYRQKKAIKRGEFKPSHILY